MRKVFAEATKLIIWMMLSLCLALLINRFVIVNAQVISSSMEGTIATDARVFGLRSGFSSPPARGDIIAFASPLPQDFPENFIKRIIALEGESIEILNGQTFINGVILHENYISEAARRDLALTTVPAGHVFVMGDNRNNSRDSRHFGAIPMSSIIGRIYIY